MGIKYIDPEQVGELIGTVQGRKGIIGDRDTAIVRALWETGARIDELLSVKLADVNLSTQEIKIRNGKGNKSRTVVWRNPATTEVLQKWIDEKPDSDYLFTVVRSPGVRKGDDKGTSTRGNKLHPNSFRASFKRYVEKSHLPEWVSPHTMRHSFSVYMLDRGLSLPELQVLLGHSSLAVTGVYLQVRNKQALDKAKKIKDDW